jgi:uncharacterized membrane protein YdbT with pleckstrin-like domain
MSYTESQLLPGERIKYQGRLSVLPFLPAYILGGILAVAGIIGLGLSVWWLAIAGFGLALPILIWTYITQTSSEFSITDRRVVIKVGWIQRRTLETMLAKVETIGVEQSLIGRVLGYGTIVVMGTGGTKESFKNIARPLEFRRQVQTQISSTDDRARVAIPEGASTPGTASSTNVRDERECPYCAELILKKARVCKHCQRDVEALEV